MVIKTKFVTKSQFRKKIQYETSLVPKSYFVTVYQLNRSEHLLIEAPNERCKKTFSSFIFEKF